MGACFFLSFSTLPGVIVPGTGSQPSYTASSEQAPIHFTAENIMSGTGVVGRRVELKGPLPAQFPF